MTSSDYKKSRKLDFPQCAKDALIRIGKLNENGKCGKYEIFFINDAEMLHNAKMSNEFETITIS